MSGYLLVDQDLQRPLCVGCLPQWFLLDDVCDILLPICCLLVYLLLFAICLINYVRPKVRLL